MPPLIDFIVLQLLHRSCRLSNEWFLLSSSIWSIWILYWLLHDTHRKSFSSIRFHRSPVSGEEKPNFLFCLQFCLIVLGCRGANLVRNSRFNSKGVGQRILKTSWISIIHLTLIDVLWLRFKRICRTSSISSNKTNCENTRGSPYHPLIHLAHIHGLAVGHIQRYRCEEPTANPRKCIIRAQGIEYNPLYMIGDYSSIGEIRENQFRTDMHEWCTLIRCNPYRTVLNND